MRLQSITLAVLTLGAVVLGVLNVRQQYGYRLPDDGVYWMDSSGGVMAGSVVVGGPAQAAGVKTGDVLISINGQPVPTAAEASRKLFGLAIGERSRYHLLRQGIPTALDITPRAQIRPAALRTYLRFVGLLYLVLGMFVLWRRFPAPRAILFYLFCLTSFVLCVFSYTGRLDALDWAVYWASVAALLLQPALFAHFCWSYALAPGRRSDSGGRRMRFLLGGIYGTAAVLGATHLTVALGVLRSAAVPLVELRWLLDRLEMGYLALLFFIGIGLLAGAYREARTRLLRKQIGWVMGGALLAVGPFAAFYAVPYFWGVIPTAWMNLSAFSLIFLPIACSYAVVRYRLLDVDILLECGIAYTLATGVLVGVYLGVVALAGDFFRANFPAAGTLGLVSAVIATGLAFRPLQRWIQTRLERHFLPRKYDYREALLGFGRELSSETNLDSMIESLLDQLVRTLHLKRAAVFVPTGAELESFVLRGSAGIPEAHTPNFHADFGFLRLLGESRAARERALDRLFLPDRGGKISPDLEAAVSGNIAWSETLGRLELHYYIACRSKGRLVAVLGLGKTEEGELLSEQDAALLETLAGYLAIAVENGSLVQSLAAKADQYERLQQFSENILESINVGLMAVDLEDRIEAVNTPLAMMYPLLPQECRGRKLADVFPPDLVEQLDRLRDDAGIHNIYRYRMRNTQGEERVLHIAIAPLLSKNCDSIGRLVIFDDVTDRVTLETQLAQAEKLSSLGLLAAGVAHEVNTPLAVISTQAQMLAKQLPPGERTSKTVEKIISQTFRASEIINSLLNFSRTKGATFGPVEVNRVISETLLLLDHQFKTAEIQVESRLEPALPSISGNSDKLQQVFLNLFLNAKDAMPEGGRLRVATWAEDSVVRVEISDTGIGIASENLHRIFDPFFTTKGAGRGTGLGLAVSYGIIHEHSGKIQAESLPGLGTRFRLEFPALRKAVHA